MERSRPPSQIQGDPYEAIRERLTYANVVATLALFLALGGVGIAATKLPKNSVGTKQMKKGAVTGAKVKKHTLTGNNINLTSSGPSPRQSGRHRQRLLRSEPFRLVGSAGQPPFLDGTINLPPKEGVTFRPVGFYKDHEGVVHLEGMAERGEGENPIEGLMFQLPPGFRPAAGLRSRLPERRRRRNDLGPRPDVVSNGQNSPRRRRRDGGKETIATLSGITFRAEG